MGPTLGGEFPMDLTGCHADPRGEKTVTGSALQILGDWLCHGDNHGHPRTSF
jgi:hypothetical protein